MKQIASAEFRVRYIHLTEPHEVTVNGWVIGRWTPAITRVPDDAMRGPGADAAYRKLQASGTATRGALRGGASRSKELE